MRTAIGSFISSKERTDFWNRLAGRSIGKRGSANGFSGRSLAQRTGKVQFRV